MEVLYENEQIQIRLNSKHKCIECQTKKPMLGGDQIKDSMEKIYEFVCKTNCNKLLPILGDMENFPEEVRLWAMSDWFPRLVKQGIRTYAVVTTNSTLVKKCNANKPENKFGIITAYFKKIEEARVWISSLNTN